MITEEEAKEKWCPQPWNSEASAEKCSGSTCMAWRWSKTKETKAFLADVVEEMRKQDKPNFNTAVQEVYRQGKHTESTEGYCGLAGKPE